MSSFTFSSEPNRRFVLWLLALVLLPLMALFVVGIYLQPLFGDLTRIGLYSERQFGWNSSQVIFPKAQFEFDATLEDGNRHFDILVLGDSFSWYHPDFLWQNYVAAASRESIGTMDINRVQLRQILASQMYRQHPPEVLIVESVERELPSHLKNDTMTCNATPEDSRTFDTTPPIAQSLDLNRNGHLAGITRHLHRKTELSEINPGYVLKYLRHNLLFSENVHPHVYRMALTRAAPFSNRDPSALLVYEGDVSKTGSWDEMGLGGMDCRIEAMRRKVEANGYTRFVLMVPPDKMTAYAEFLSDSKLRHVSLLSKLSDRHPNVMPRLDKALLEAIDSGEQDVYFPDDTHWASNGERIVAETLIPFLERRIEH